MKLIKKAGIYCILNIINEKFYIGSAKNLRARYSRHFSDLKNDSHCNEYLLKSYRKYGKNNFIFLILEFTEIEDLIIREQFYIDNHQPEYNICKIAGSVLGRRHKPETIEKIKKNGPGWKHTEDSREKMRIGQSRITEEQREAQILRLVNFNKSQKGQPKSEEHKRKISESNMGKEFSLETREKMSKIRTGKKFSEATKKKMSDSRTGFKFSEESKLKMSQSQPQKKKIDQFDLEGNFIRRFDSVNGAAKILGVSPVCIRRNLSLKYTRYRQWIFKYVENN